MATFIATLTLCYPAGGIRLHHLTTGRLISSLGFVFVIILPGSNGREFHVVRTLSRWSAQPSAKAACFCSPEQSNCNVKLCDDDAPPLTARPGLRLGEGSQQMKGGDEWRAEPSSRLQNAVACVPHAHARSAALCVWVCNPKRWEHGNGIRMCARCR